ncbi:MAG: cadherin repeat domain-containing protein [Chloroflexota bacterium]|nr:cadherin repeat domain-containing protein [Chloroflexota bacterium]
MNVVTNASIPLRLFGAVLALTLIAAIAVAVTLTAGPTQAQNADNTYTNPQPCGPAAETAFQPEPHEITTGHFALFDAYWEWLPPEPAQLPGQDPQDPVNVGLLHTNTCPPKVTETTETDRDGNTTTTTSLVASGIDIDEAIFHVENDRKVTVAEGDPDDTNASHLSLFQYPEVDDYANVGDQVWWLRLDDPDLDGNQKSDLTLGFSTERFDEKYWTGVRYEFRLERNPGIDPADHPHLLAYRARLLNLPGSDLIWDSNEPHVKALEMQPGQLEDLQWIFTKPGTYEIWVRLLGYVRQTKPQGGGDDWEPISGNLTETSEVKRYVIHVGDELTVNSPPAFLMERSVVENTAGAAAGAAIPVHDPDGDPLSYRLSGADSELFALSGSKDSKGRFTEPPTIVAAADALDYEARPLHYVTLHVSDGKGITNYDDTEIDNAVRVKINVTDKDETDVGTNNDGLRLVSSATRLKVGEAVNIRAAIGDLPGGATNLSVRWNVEDPPGADPVRSPISQDFTRAFTYDTPGTRSFQVGLFYTAERGRALGHRSDKITVTWVADGN